MLRVIITDTSDKDRPLLIIKHRNKYLVKTRVPKKYVDTIANLDPVDALFVALANYRLNDARLNEKYVEKALVFVNIELYKPIVDGVVESYLQVQDNLLFAMVVRKIIDILIRGDDSG